MPVETNDAPSFNNLIRKMKYATSILQCLQVGSRILNITYGTLRVPRNQFILLLIRRPVPERRYWPRNNFLHREPWHALRTQACDGRSIFKQCDVFVLLVRLADPSSWPTPSWQIEVHAYQPADRISLRECTSYVPAVDSHLWEWHDKLPRCMDQPVTCCPLAVDRRILIRIFFTTMITGWPTKFPFISNGSYLGISSRKCTHHTSNFSSLDFFSRAILSS